MLLCSCLYLYEPLFPSSDTSRFLLDPNAPSVTRFNTELYGLDGASHLVQFYAAAAYRELRSVDTKLKRLQETDSLSAGESRYCFGVSDLAYCEELALIRAK